MKADFRLNHIHESFASRVNFFRQMFPQLGAVTVLCVSCDSVTVSTVVPCLSISKGKFFSTKHGWQRQTWVDCPSVSKVRVHERR